MWWRSPRADPRDRARRLLARPSQSSSRSPPACARTGCRASPTLARAAAFTSAPALDSTRSHRHSRPPCRRANTCCPAAARHPKPPRRDPLTSSSQSACVRTAFRTTQTRRAPPTAGCARRPPCPAPSTQTRQRFRRRKQHAAEAKPETRSHCDTRLRTPRHLSSRAQCPPHTGEQDFHRWTAAPRPPRKRQTRCGSPEQA